MELGGVVVGPRRRGAGLRDGVVEVGTTLHGHCRVEDAGMRGHADGLGAVGAAAAGQGGVDEGVADVEGDDGVEAHGLVEDGSEELHFLEVGVGWVAVADVGRDFVAEARDGVRVARELEEAEGEGGGGGVTAGEEDGDELVADDLWVAGEAGEGVQEGVLFGQHGVELLGGHAEDGVDEGLHEVVHAAEVHAEAFAGVKGAKWTAHTVS